MSYAYNNVTIKQMLDTGPVGHVITTTKGDVITDNGTKSLRLPVGTNGQLFFANSATATGLEWRTGTPADVGLGNVQNTLDNFAGVVDPTVNDDSGDGYSVGSVWFNQTDQTTFALFDATVGAAVWVQTYTPIAGAGLVLTGKTFNVGGSATIFANANDLVVNSSAIAGQVLLSSGTVGTAATYGAITLSNTNSVTGTLPIANGGTGASSFTTGNRIIATNVGNTALVDTSLDPSQVVTLTGTQTLTNKTLTNPIIGTNIVDTNTNNIIGLTPTASAVNNIDVTNSATGSGPTIAAVGTDTNVELNLTGKGTGAVTLSNIAYPTADGTVGQVLSTDGAGTLSFVSVQTVATGSTTTTNATPTTIITIPTISNTSYQIDSKYIARNTSNAAIYVSFGINATFTNNGGTVTKQSEISYQSDIATTWTVSAIASGTNIILQVVGAAATNIAWFANNTTISV